MTVPAWPERGDRDYVEKTADVIAGIQTGALPIPLAGIEGALGAYEPLTNMRELEINALDGAGVVGDGVTDCLSGLQAQLDSAANLVAAHPNIHGAKVILPPGVYGISGQLVVPSNVEFVGCGKGASRVMALSGFPANTPVVKLGKDAVAWEHGMAIKNISIDCNNVSGSSGVFSQSAQEPSGLWNVTVSRFKKYGVWIEDLSGVGTYTPAMFTIDHCELFHSSGALASVRIVGTLNTTALNQTTITAYDLSSDIPIGVQAIGSPIVAIGVHIEHCDDGFVVTKGSNNAGSATIIAPTGHGSISGALVSITDTAPHVVIGAFGNGSTAIVSDSLVAGGVDAATPVDHVMAFYTNRTLRSASSAHGIATIDHTMSSPPSGVIAETVICDSSGGTVSFSLTSVAHARPGATRTIKRTGANAVQVYATGGATVDGNSYAKLDSDLAWVTVVFDGSNWHIIGQGGTVTLHV